jgi:hypothetical protein
VSAIQDELPAPADTLIRGLLDADPATIAACFTADGSLRALTPPGLRERDGAPAIGELMAGWFADCTRIDLLAASSATVVDRLHISYRMSAVKDGRGACVIEQQLYAELTGDRLRNVTLVCSGFRPLPD